MKEALVFLELMGLLTKEEDGKLFHLIRNNKLEELKHLLIKYIGKYRSKLVSL